MIPTINQREVNKRYAKLINDVETSDFYKIDLTNRVNCYRCQSCGQITKTKDVDAGVTPFIFNCMHCGKEAYSSFYKDIAPQIEPSFEWYRPSLYETLKLRKKINSIEHVLNGGLLSRKVETGRELELKK
jgi:hypothetical protein